MDQKSLSKDLFPSIKKSLNQEKSIVQNFPIQNPCDKQRGARSFNRRNHNIRFYRKPYYTNEKNSFLWFPQKKTTHLYCNTWFATSCTSKTHLPHTHHLVCDQSSVARVTGNKPHMCTPDNTVGIIVQVHRLQLDRKCTHILLLHLNHTHSRLKNIIIKIIKLDICLQKTYKNFRNNLDVLKNSCTR